MIYEKLRDKDAQKSSYELNNPAVEWNTVFKTLINLGLNAKAITINYKICLNGLPTFDKFKNFVNKCFICKRKKENINHLFFECENPKRLLTKIWEEHEKDRQRTWDENAVLFHSSCSFEEIKILSAFKLAVWNFRQISKGTQPLTMLERIFIRELISF